MVTARQVLRDMERLDTNLYEFRANGRTWRIAYYPPMGQRGYWHVGEIRLDFVVDEWSSANRHAMATAVAHAANGG